MSYNERRVYFVTCDKCGRSGPQRATWRDVVDIDADQNGWHISPNNDGTDRCPDCQGAS